LHKLLLEGAVEVREVPQKGRPAKKVYRITDGGRKELECWLREPAAADQIRREFLLKLYLAKDMPSQVLLALVTTRRGEMETMLQALNAERNDATNTRQIWVMDYAVSLCQAEMDWLKQLEAKLGVA
jgi:hypothetical protein